MNHKDHEKACVARHQIEAVTADYWISHHRDISPADITSLLLVLRDGYNDKNHPVNDLANRIVYRLALEEAELNLEKESWS